MAETESPFYRVVETVMKAARQIPESAKAENVAGVIKRKYGVDNGPRIRHTVESAKKLVADAKAKGQHVTLLGEWAKNNKFSQPDQDPAKAFEIAQKDLRLALKVWKVPPESWITKAADDVKCAEAAQALTVVAMAPPELQKNPNFLFQTAAQLAVSNSRPEAQSAIKAFIREMETEPTRGVNGFVMGKNELRQLLTAEGMGAIPTPPPEEFLGQDISKLPAPVKRVFMTMNEDLLEEGVNQLKLKLTPEQKRIIEINVLNKITSYDTLLAKIDTSGFEHEDIHLFTEVSGKLSSLRENLTYHLSSERGIEAETIAEWAGVLPDTLRDKGPLHTRLSKEKVRSILRPGRGEEPSGADQFYEELSDRIFTSGKEAHSPDLTDQYEYGDFEQILRYAFGEQTPLTNKYRTRWNDDYPRNAVITRTLGGYGGEKELIQLSSSIPSDTLNYETRVRFAPEVIAQAEMLIPRLAAEERYQYDQSVRYVTGEYQRPGPGGGSIEEHGRRLNRADVWNKYSTTRSQYFPDEAEYTKMNMAMRAGHGSMVHDRWIVTNMPEQLNLASLTRALDAEINSKLTPGMTQDQKDAVTNSVVAPHKERLRVLWQKVTLKDTPDEMLFNPGFLEKIRGLSPYEIQLFNWLEKTKPPDTPLFELRKAILAQRRFMVGSKRIFSLVGTLSNMPGLEFTPSGPDVMVESLEYVMRTEQAERFVFNRFGMGKEEAGKRMAAVEQEALCRLRGVELKKLDDLKTAIKGDESIPMRRYRTVALKARDAYGVGYTQLAIGTFLDSTCPFDYGTWRPEEAIIRVLDEKFGPDAENLALCIRLRMTDTGKGEGKGEEKFALRSPLVDKIMRREPSVLILRLGSKEFDETVLRGNGISPGTQEWDRFLTVLGHAERRVFTEHEFYSNSAVDLGNPECFNKVFTDDVFLKSRLSKDDILDIPALKTKYLKIIQETQSVFKDPQQTGQESYAHMWKQYGMPMTLSLTDFDLTDADFERLPKSSQFRADVGDTMSRLEARTDFMTILKDPNISMPEDATKTLIPALQKLNDDIVAYKDPRFTEERVGIMLDSVLSLNVAKDFYRGMITAVPFLPEAFRAIVGQDARKPLIKALLWPAQQLAIGYTYLTRQPDLRKLLRTNLEEFPKIFGQEFISGAAAIKGVHGNALRALGTERLLQQIEHAGIFTDHKHLHDLKDKYKTRAWYKGTEIVGRYWWVPFAAAIAVGVAIAMKEQGLDEERHR